MLWPAAQSPHATNNDMETRVTLDPRSSNVYIYIYILIYSYIYIYMYIHMIGVSASGY